MIQNSDANWTYQFFISATESLFSISLLFIYSYLCASLMYLNILILQRLGVIIFFMIVKTEPFNIVLMSKWI
jgi:hypothetical protein